MKFRFIGEEPSDFMGFHWNPGSEHDVTDPHAVKKLSGSALFEAFEKAPAEAPKKNAKKSQPVTDNGDNAHQA